MIRWLLLFCVFLVPGAGIYYMIAGADSYLVIVWGNTSIAMRIWFATFCLVSAVVLLWVTFAVFRRGFRGVSSVTKTAFTFGNSKARARILEGLLDYFEANWAPARKKLIRSAPKAKVPLLNYLAAAHSASEMGDRQAALELLNRAENFTGEGSLAIAINRARIQLADQQYEQARESIALASSINQQHPAVLDLRQQLCVALQDWPALKALLPQLDRNTIGTADSRHRLKTLLYREWFAAQTASRTDLVSSQSLDVKSNAERVSTLKKYWSEIPRELQWQPWFVATFASQLMALDEHDSASKLLLSNLNRQWHSQWVDLFGLLQCKNPKKLLRSAEKWLSDHSDSPQLLLAVGRLCIQNQQWDRAAGFLQKSLARQQRSETYAELSRLYEYLGETEKSIFYCKRGLMANTSALVTARRLSDLRNRSEESGKLRAVFRCFEENSGSI